ncbi:MAG: hypothetical protein KF774_05110 [Planctomyces sp.]|nr:hypothetical protein [Planctomyces sp.]
MKHSAESQLPVAALTSATLAPEASARADAILHGELQLLHARTDRLFCGLLVFQWIAGIAAARWVSPLAWAGTSSWIHIHLLAAIFLVGFLIAFPIGLALKFPGRTLTRHVVAMAQLMTSAILIHLSGGRIETHFHVFGSLAFLSVYRDVRVLGTATLVAVADHALRGAFLPESVYGVSTASLWRTAEHGGWVLFENLFLTIAIRMSLRDMRRSAAKEAILELTNRRIEAEVEQRTRELKDAQDELSHAERMASIGRLAAGIAHEINTPLQFIGDNLRASTDMLRDLQTFDEASRAARAELGGLGTARETLDALDELDRQIDVPFLLQDVPVALGQSLKGLERIRTIVLAMKEFAPNGRLQGREPVDVNAGIRHTLTVAHNELKYCATVDVELGEVEPALGNAGELNQVFLNLLINAAHAIQELRRDEPGRIGVRTFMDGGQVVVEVSDDGCGMTDEIRRKAFDPFFTTKPPGRGAGQGLAICHAVIVDRHGGRIDVDSEPGRGSTFAVRLPAHIERQAIAPDDGWAAAPSASATADAPARPATDEIPLVGLKGDSQESR